MQLVLDMNRQAAEFSVHGRFAEATELLLRAIKLAPEYASSHHNLGAIYTMSDKLQEAASAYEIALRLDPQSAKSHFNLANLYRKLRKNKLAIKHLKRTMELDPKHHSAAHMLAATEGRTTDRAPSEYVKHLFDQYAPSFELTLVQKLSYTIPTALKNLLLATLTEKANFHSAIDLGCGTGLVGLEFSALCTKLQGVDVSPLMLDRAKAKSLYAGLYCDEMTAFLERTSEKFDLFIAADSLIYIGDLHALFGAIKNSAAENAMFVFSTEHCVVDCKEKGFSLNDTGRFGHSLEYIQKLAVEFGMKVLENQELVIRKEVGADVLGNVFVVQV